MRTKTFVAVAATALPLAAHVQGVRIVQSNDDGWAELYVRSFHDSLIAAGHDVVLSAPAENKSGTGKSSQFYHRHHHHHHHHHQSRRLFPMFLYTSRE